MTHIHCIDLSTGRSWRADADRAARVSLPSIGAALAYAISTGGPAAVPWSDAMAIRATPRGKCLEWSALVDGSPVFSAAVAGHSRCGATAWRALLSDRVTAGDPDKQPRAPWAAVLPAALGGLPDHLATLAGQVALAWLEHLETRQHAD